MLWHRAKATATERWGLTVYGGNEDGDLYFGVGERVDSPRTKVTETAFPFTTVKPNSPL
ncbi:hypothetical protein PTE30175_04887 [Pandoraea terrae]|uniref:Uncharacterized protein n=1 Tax=Pandoraea terrae TaxID=1537710 RepID=A0A5E4Z250_9BURK|nr:hypothetical protein PTE30175_04887 [Pandoraea terrae]